MALIFATISVQMNGGLVAVLHIPPTRNSSTPASQDGYTLVEVDGGATNWRGDREYTFASAKLTTGGATKITLGMRTMSFDDAVGGLWISTPSLDVPTRDLQDRRPTDPLHLKRYSDLKRAIGLHVTMSRPSGRTVDLDAAYFPKLNPPMLFVPIQGGYPDTVHYLDIAISDPQRHKARWRITRLTPSLRLLPSKLVTQFQSGNNSVTAEAVRNPPTSSSQGRIDVRLYPRLVRPQQRWDLEMNRTRPEWEASAVAHDELNCIAPLMGLSDRFSGGWPPMVPGIENPFVDDDHYVRVSGKLRHFDFLRETVTFHGLPITNHSADPKVSAGEPWNGYHVNLTTPRVQTTASGIKVRLPAQHPIFDPGNMGSPNRVSVVVDVSTKLSSNVVAPADVVSLPNSPLQRKYGQSPRLSMQVGLPQRMQMYQGPVNDMGDGFHEAGVRVDGPATYFDSKTRKWISPALGKTVDLTIAFDQRIDLDAIPFSLTVPVRNATKADWPPKPGQIVVN